MRMGSPGFVPRRLVEARNARGLTQLALADQIGVKRSTIGNYESGAGTPGPDVLEKIAAATALPLQFFLKGESAPEPGATFLRALRSASPALCARADVNAKWAGDLTFELLHDIELPVVDLPDFRLNDPTTLTNERIEAIAVETRRHWGLGLGPISNVVWLLENKGTVVVRCELGDPRLDGLSHWRGERPVVLLASDRGSGARSRFDAAHELGHLLLHRSVTAERLRSTGEWRLLENQAHRFAAAFLFPQEAFMAEVPAFDLDTLQKLKPVWKVSIKMMVMRAANLGLMSEERRRQLLINYNRRGYASNEPLEATVAVELPRLLRRAVELAAQERGIDALLERLAVGAGDFERLTGIAPRSLASEGGVVVTLRKPLSVPSAVSGAAPGDVLPFRR